MKMVTDQFHDPICRNTAKRQNQLVGKLAAWSDSIRINVKCALASKMDPHFFNITDSTQK